MKAQYNNKTTIAFPTATNESRLSPAQAGSIKINLKVTLTKVSVLIFIGIVLTFGSANAVLIPVNFDTDPNGNAINAPSLFVSTTHLTELYSPLGIHFTGPGGNDGGAILNQLGGFGLNAHSGVNFLAFNRGATMMDSGIPRDPEIITFDTLMTDVSIFAAGASSSKTFLMQAFDVNGALVDTDTITTQQFSLLQVNSLFGIKSVALSVTIPPSGGAFVFDDLSANTQAVPEPSTALFGIAVMAAGFMGGTRRCRQHA